MKNEVTYKAIITTEIYLKIIECGIIGIHFFPSSSHSFPLRSIRNYVPKIVFVEIIVYDKRVKSDFILFEGL